MEKTRDRGHNEKWENILRKMVIRLYWVVLFAEVAIYFVLRSQNMIFQSTGVYMKRYLIKPVLISTLIIAIGFFVISKLEDTKLKKDIHLIMITLMFGNIVNVHSIFLITMVIFCVPIFLTVVLQNRRLLNFITVLSEVFVGYTAISDYITQTGASNDAYFIPSVIIVVILLLACRTIAAMSIDVLNEQNSALIKATEDAKEAKRIADASNQSKTVFLSSMSHEIRTPINAVLGLDEMIIRESEDPVIRDYALDIRSSGKALLALVNDVLDFSRIESGRMDLVIVEYDVSSMINDLVNMIMTRASEKGLKFDVEVDPNIPHLLLGDEIRIKQIIMNLLTNAVKYTDRGEVKLCLNYEKMNDSNIRLMVMVRDTGKGIKKEDLVKLFEPFERIEEKRNRNIEGTGLGMSITKSLLDLMGSELQVESVYGLGSDFSFSIEQEVKDWNIVGDYQETYHRMREKEAKYQEQFVAPDAKVLVVDDTPINIKVFAGLLKKTRIQIDAVSSGAECLQYASKNQYHMIFIDHMMPDMDGIETLKRLKQDEDSLNKDVPAVALTANAISGSRDFYLREGFDEYLTKPIEPNKLEKMMIRFLPKEIVLKKEDR